MTLLHSNYGMEWIYFAILIAGTLGLCLTMTTKKDLCPQVLKIDCLNSYRPEGNETVCCSDLQVYNNLCFFAQQKCRIPNLHVLYPGMCKLTTPSPISGTNDPLPASTTHKPGSSGDSDYLHDVFCENKNKFNCSDELDPVCGTDYVFYRNDCEFAKAQCLTKDLDMQDLSTCKVAQRFKRVLDLI